MFAAVFPMFAHIVRSYGGCTRGRSGWYPRILAVFLACVNIAHADEPAPASAQDLQYGEVLYHYYQQDWFNSIVRTHIAQQQQRLPNHADEAELLLGGLDLNYGLRNAAEDIFTRLLAEVENDQQTRNRAWYYLAKISYQRGDQQRALRSLGQLEGEMSTGTRMESAQLASLVLLQANAHEQAIAVLEDARKHRVWSPYLAYNLGVAQIRSQREADGFDYLDNIGELRANSEEYRLLRDKANLALGYSLLQSGETEASRAALNRVRLQGPLSSKALLGAGWADAENEAFGHALVPWLELSQRDPTDPAVQEALLAVPYAMTKMALHGRAVDQYNAAITTLYDEQDALDTGIAAIRRGELLEVLREQDLRSGTGWLQDLSFNTEHPVLRYQVTLLAAHDFQEAVKNYRDLLILQQNLTNWTQAIDAYDDMLVARAKRFGRHKPAAQAALGDGRRAALLERQQVLATRLAAIEAAQDPVGLATADERHQWQRLQAIERRLDGLPDTPRTRALRDKRDRLQGILYWQLSAVYKVRLWEARRALAQVNALLDTTRENLVSLAQAEARTPAGFSGFAGRIDTNRARIDALLARTARTQLAQGRLIEQIAVRELEAQKERLDTYIVQARFALAQTYDSALVAGKGESP